jgi:hypothetical protein
MKTKSIRNIFALALIPFTVFACSRFEDGPKVSFRSVMKRIYGTYRIEYFSKNEVDIMPYWNQYYNITFVFQLDESQYSNEAHSLMVQGTIMDSSNVVQNYSIGYPLSINYESDKVEFWMNNYMWDSTIYPGRKLYPIFIYPDEEAPVFLITRLTDKEMWIEHISSSDVYEIHLKE